MYILLHYVYSPVPQPGSLGPRCARLCQSCLVFELIHSDHVTSLRDEHCEKWLSRYFFSRITFPKVYPCFVLKATPERIWSGVRARATALLRYLVNLLVPFVPGPESIWLLQRVCLSSGERVSFPVVLCLVQRVSGYCREYLPRCSCGVVSLPPSFLNPFGVRTTELLH